MTITITYTAAPTTLSGYTWTDRSPWIAEPQVQYVRTFVGGSMYDQGIALPTCTVKGFAQRTAANETALTTIASKELRVSDGGATWTARVTGISDAGSTAAYLIISLNLRRKS